MRRARSKGRRLTFFAWLCIPSLLLFLILATKESKSDSERDEVTGGALKGEFSDELRTMTIPVT